ncbi:hypothetical protein O6H91_17G089200 [Diphasiastrum complanatum]|uniref:Uncharacterized protein n=1 Tax=Diphasiastrum complanatum TaxID=34168 RepID=A0ACC2B8Z5_DIPCM|nr:hypothetical protein O6H91_17G089200 [Diphasiastrum complanatum]
MSMDENSLMVVVQLCTYACTSRNFQPTWHLRCWNVNGLLNTLKDAAHRYSSASHYFAQVLQADIVCFQEAKIQEEKLEKWMAFVHGYDSFWAFSKIKKGYSGVVTYVKEDISPLDARADWFGDEDTAEELRKEGRLMYTDHGNFVLLNVYVPNAGDRQEGRPRLSFKLNFLEALEHLCDKIVNSGKHIVVVGDFNIAHKQKDVHKRWNLEDMYSPMWDMKTSARAHNEGQRIDYALCDPEFLPQVEDVEIKKMIPKQWSDHAAIVVTLLDQPLLPRHPAPAISSRNMRQFQDDLRQKKLTTLLSGRPSKDFCTDQTCGQNKGNEPGISSISNQEQSPANPSNVVGSGNAGMKHKISREIADMHSRVTKQKSVKSYFRANNLDEQL